jgi:hypothetical protein
MVTTTATSISDMNAKAVLCLRELKNKEAIALFSHALHVLSDIVLLRLESAAYQSSIVDPNDSTTPTTEAHAEADYVCIEVVSQEDIRTRSEAPVSVALNYARNSSLDDSDNSCVYTRSFLLPTLDDYLLTPRNYTEASAILLFNLALAYHRHAVLTGQSKIFEKAKTLYSKALLLLEQEFACIGQEGSSLAIVLLAIANNAAAIHAELFDVDSLRCSLTLFRRVLKWIGLNNHLPNYEEYRCFHLNLLFLESCCSVAASA